MVAVPLVVLAVEKTDHQSELNTAQQGVLSAKHWSFINRELFLTGEWDVVWGELVAPNEFEGRFKGDTFHLPNNWNSVTTEPMNGPFGVATFRLRLRLPKHPRGLTFHIVSPNSAWRLYVDSEFVGGNGVVSDDAEKFKAHYISRFLAAKDENSTLVLQVANFSHAYGGPQHAMALWDKPTLTERLHFMSLWFVLALGVLLCIGLIHIIFYIADKKYQEAGSVHLWFALLCFILVFRISGIIPFFHLYTPESLYWSDLTITYITLFTAPAVYLLFFRSAFPKQFPDKLTRSIAFFSLAWAVFVLFSPERMYTHLRDFAIFINVFVIGYSLIFNVFAIRAGESGARTIFVSNTLFGLAAVNDAVTYSQGGNGFDMTPFGIMILGLGYSYALLQRLQSAYKATRESALALEQLNVKLEQTVRERTRSFKSAAAKAENSAREKTRFIAAASHDLRQPLAALGLFNATLKQGINEPKKLELIDQQSDAIKNLRNLLKDTLEASKVDSFQREPEVVEINVSNLLETLCNGFMLRAEALNIKLSTQFDQGTVFSDSVMLQRILSNLIDNALKAARSQVSVRAEFKNAIWVFSVTDDGRGIAPSDVNKIFEYYVTLDNGSDVPNQNALSSNEGYGLGLFVVKEFTKILGGEVVIAKTSDQGSTFELLLPEINAH